MSSNTTYYLKNKKNLLNPATNIIIIKGTISRASSK